MNLLSLDILLMSQIKWLIFWMAFRKNMTPSWSILLQPINLHLFHMHMYMGSFSIWKCDWIVHGLLLDMKMWLNRHRSSNYSPSDQTSSALFTQKIGHLDSQEEMQDDPLIAIVAAVVAQMQVATTIVEIPLGILQLLVPAPHANFLTFLSKFATKSITLHWMCTKGVMHHLNSLLWLLYISLQVTRLGILILEQLIILHKTTSTTWLFDLITMDLIGSQLVMV